MLCQTAFHFHSPSPCKALDKLTQHKCFWIHLWPVSSKYSANMKSGPKNPLNKHNETPTASMRTICNETSDCVFSSWLILGCSCVCGLPTTNSKKHLQRAIRLNNCFSNSQPTEYFHIGFLWQHFRLFGHIWVQFTNQLHICRFYNILQRLVCVFHYWFFWCVSFRLVIGLYFFLFQLQTIKLNKAQRRNSDPVLHWLRATKGVKLLQKTVYKKTGITSLIPILSLQYKTI